MRCKGSGKEKIAGEWVVCPVCFERLKTGNPGYLAKAVITVPEHDRESAGKHRAFQIRGGMYN